MVLARLGRRACLVVVLSLIPASVFAQGASTATIAGVVRDASGGVLPGVTIEAASPALIEKVRSTVTDDRGEYRLPELRPGNYVVTYTLPGFSTVKRDGLELRTNFTAQVDIELKVSQLEETITVSGATPLVGAALKQAPSFGPSPAEPTWKLSNQSTRPLTKAPAPPQPTAPLE